MLNVKESRGHRTKNRVCEYYLGHVWMLPSLVKACLSAGSVAALPLRFFPLLLTLLAFQRAVGRGIRFFKKLF